MNTENQEIQRTQTRSMIFKKILIFLGNLIFSFFLFFFHIIYFSFFSFVLCKWISDPASIFCFQRRVKENWKSKISYEIKKNVKNESFERRYYKWFTIWWRHRVLKKYKNSLLHDIKIVLSKFTIKIQQIKTKPIPAHFHFNYKRPK